MKKRFLAMMCSMVLCIQLAIPAVGLLAEAENKAIESTNPFALMYDSDERLAESLEEQWDILMKTHTEEIQMEGDQSAQISEESAGEFSSSAREPDQSSLSRSQDKDILQQSIVSLARSGNLKDVQDFALPEEATEQIERMVEDSGESRFIVKYRHSARRDQDAETLRSHSAEKQALEEGLELLTLPERVNPAIFAEELRAAGMESEIEYIQPDFALSIDSLRLTAVEEQPGDEAVEVPPVPKEGEIPLPDEGETPADETLPEEQSEELQDEPEKLHDEPEKPALEEETSHSPIPVTVALIDTGVDTSHPALAGYLGEGWNFVEDTADIHNPEHPLASGHGTHLAGIIARTAEEYGADVTILPLKVFENGAAHTSDIIAAIAWAEEKGAAIINCSFGSTNENPALYDSITASSALFVAAAGNSRRDLSETPSYPACYDLPNLISVGSVNADGGFSYFSNYSSDLLDITALGRDVISAVPDGDYGSMTGTSMAAAQVSGAAAVAASLSGAAAEPAQTTADLVSEEPLYWDDLAGMYLQADILPSVAEETSALNVEQLRELLLNSADRLDNLQNKAEDGRRLNLDNALVGNEGEILNLNPEDDFDVHGYRPTQSELFELYSQSGKIIQIETGEDFTVAVKQDGTVWTWGSNYYGQLGDGTTVEHSTPAQVIGLGDVIGVSTGYSHALAVKRDGTVWAWGDNSYGQLGDLTTTTRLTPVQVCNLGNIAKVAAGSYHNIAIDRNGVGYSWGANYYGQLGDNSDEDKPFPELVFRMENIVAIAAGAGHSLAIRGDGILLEWGRPYIERDSYYIPQVRDDLENIVAIAAGSSHSLALKQDGTVWGWGYNSSGQFGDGSRESSDTPRQVMIDSNGEYLDDVIDIAAGSYHSLALKNDGTVWECGGYSYGEYGGTGNPTVAIQAESLSNINCIAAGGESNFARKSDGTVWAWGSNAYGQLGDGSVRYSPIPIVSPELSDFTEAIAARDDNSLAIKEDGTVWAWGNNARGQLGDGTTTVRSAPVQVTGLTDVISVVAGDHHSLALKEDETVWAWGDNSYGQIGDSTKTNRSTPVQVIGLTDVISVAAGDSHSLAVKEDGTVWAWGDNARGQLGDSTKIYKSAPVQVLGLTGVISVAAGDSHSLALKEDGTVWAWGFNARGQLGDGTTTDRSTPVQITGLTGVIRIVTGGNHSLAIKEDGTVWAWGYNSYGQIGDSTKTNRSAPVQISALTGVINIAAGYSHSLAIRQDGTVWAWGANYNSQLGDGSTINRSAPVQVIGLTGVVNIAAGYNHSLAIKEDGIVWAWGNNYYNQLGLPYVEVYRSPIQIYQSTTEPEQGTQLKLDLVQGSHYLVALSASDIATFDGMTVMMEYDPTELQLENIAEQAYSAWTTPGTVPGTDISITGALPGQICLEIDRDIPSGKVWSGVITVLKFKALTTGESTLSLA
jgi:alpha-tubulin suppressor-like RCC1 family protein